MTWFKEAMERRTVTPFQLTQAPVLATMDGELLLESVSLAQKKFENSRTHRKKIVDAAARWDVFQEEREWDRILLRFTLRIDDVSVFQETPCWFAVQALCKRTRWRSAEVCDFHPEGGSISLWIPRKQVAGELVITPLILHAGSAGEVDSAAMKGKRLAGGFPMTLMIDPPGDRFGSGMEMRWFPFPADQQNSLFYLDLESDVPLLLINKSHPALKNIFEDRSKTGTRQRLRNALFSFIAVDVWLQLAQFAGEIARLEIDDDQDPKVVLSRKILQSLARMLKVREDAILQSSKEPSQRAYLHRLLQHHFRLASHQDALVSGLVEEGAQ